MRHSLPRQGTASQFAITMRNFRRADLNLSLRLGSLAFVRSPLLAILAACSAIAGAQGTRGNYAPPGGTPQPWLINSNHTLVWGGAPYLPVGLRIDGAPAEVAKAKAAGFQDVIVDLPATGTGWADTLKALKESGMRYLVSISSLSPMAEGVTIDPAGYRVSGILKPQKLEVRLPGAKSALAVIVNRRDASVDKVQRVPVLDGVLSLDVKPIADLEQVLLIFPRMRSLEQADLWEAMDEHRDRLLSTLRNHELGSGLRGIINPLGKVASSTSANPQFVPTSPYFRHEFAAFLKQKYRSLETAMRAWAMAASDIQTFDELARLAPLWSGPSRGIPQLWDTDSDRLYKCNFNKSLAWADIQECVSATANRRQLRFVQAIRSVADVPVVQEWSGWSPVIEGMSPAVDGIGMHAFGTTPSELLDSASRATSTILRWRKPGWLVATDVDPGRGPDAAAQLSNVLDDLSSLGARGWFVRSGSEELVKAMATQGQRSSDVALSEYGPSAVFYPENAFNPATPQRLPGGKWWLPSPGAGNRLDFGSHLFGYRYQEGTQSLIVLWSDQPAARVKLKMLNPKLVTFSSIDGTPVNPKLAKDSVQITLGSIPVVIEGATEIPIPEPAYAETMSKMNQLFTAADSALLDVTEPRFLFRDALSGYDRNPGGSYSAMRTQFERVSLRMAPYTWIEAESSKNNNFSEVAISAGCSLGAMLSLKTQIASPSGGYTAEYNVPVKTDQDVEIWIAARIPESQRQNLELTVAGDTFKITSPPVSPYGQGFAWYRLGTTKFGGKQTKMQVQVNSSTADMALDAFLFYPGSFQPRGIRIPDAIAFAEPKK